MSFYRDYFNNFYGRIRNPGASRVIFFGALVALGVFAVTRFWPGVASGVSCSELPRPIITGNNQSILASRVDPSVLALELVVDTPSFRVGEKLTMEVRFINSSMASLTLLISPSEVVFRYTGQEPGLNFAIINAQGRTLGEPFNLRPPVPNRTTYERNDLRLLGPRSRCHMRVEIDAQRLANSGMGNVGQYRITAVYRNTSRGALPPVTALTPTPIFRDQGVWVGEIRSNDVFLAIGQ